MSRPALISNQETLTYQQLNRRVATAQKTFLKKNRGKEHCVFFAQPNSPQYVIDLLALWLLDATVCLQNVRIPKTRISKYKELLTRKKLPHAATLLFTSGSSGEPKVVVHSSTSHYFNALASNTNIPVGKNDRWLLSLPLYHVSGIGIVWRCILSGAAIVFPEGKSLEEAIKKFKVTHVSLVPTQLLRLLDNKANIEMLQNLKAILLGGAPIPEDLLKTAKKLKLRIFLTYGLTETASQVATSAKPYGPLQPLKHRELKIIKDEIWVRGQPLFHGYWKDGKLQKPFGPERWFKTGDLGSYTKKNGLKILGRKDSMFISGGENIYPEEIEKALLNTGLVDNAVVVPVKDIEFGARPIAFIMTKRKKIALENLLTQLHKTLPSFKIPRTFLPFPNPMIQKGIKPNRKALAKWLNRR